jgi:hypothetical protein
MLAGWRVEMVIRDGWPVNASGAGEARGESSDGASNV